MKKYGIYLLYPPLTDLRAQGLGRHLASFLKASLDINERKFIIACPAWMKKSLEEVLAESDLQINLFEIISTVNIPLLIKLYMTIACYLEKTSNTASGVSSVAAKSPLSLRTLIGKILRSIPFIMRLYFKIQDDQANLLNTIINERQDISAWYCPTLFWPNINELMSPRLICAPDVVFNGFPIGFALCAPHSEEQYKNVIKTIVGGHYFATYSQDVKINTLIKNYHVPHDKVFVIHHGANQLDNLIGNGKSASLDQLNSAIKTARKGYYASSSVNAPELKFLFYASQTRPNKNMLTLFRAYQYLLRQCHIKHKLLMTGDPSVIPELNDFVKENDLDNDVLWLHGITSRQLAACYHLADLSVNPSLSEGGFPFTFTESLSVGTPVVMARIDVTQEIITDPQLDEAMLFDPYDWKNMAHKIEWAIKNKELLLSKQMPLYNQLAQRTWTDVVKDYVDALDTISSGEPV